MELSAKIHSISETQNVTETFSKREFVVETLEEYKQYLGLQVIKDKCSILDNYKVGDNVMVSLNLKGRLWTNPQGEEKCFNTLECWRIEKIDQAKANETKVNEPQNLGAENESDLPF